jgi:hypothetical protein
MRGGTKPATGAVGVLLPSSLTESFEVAVARLVDLESQGVSVKALVCDGATSGCVANPLSLASTCIHCRNVRDQALSSVTRSVQCISLDQVHAESRPPALTELEQDSLMAGVESTILTFYRGDPGKPGRRSPRSLAYRTLSRRYYRHSLFVYEALRHLLAQAQLTRIEFFNGRIVPTRAAMLASQHAGCDFGVLEVSGRDRKLTVADNSSVHDLAYKRGELRRFIARGEIDLAAGAAFYESRRKGLDTNDRSFTSGQEQGRVPKSGRPIVAVFTSSADELKVAGSQWFTEASRDPVAFITSLAALVRDAFDVVVRMHPNQQGDKTGAARAMMRELSGVQGIKLVTPNSKVSTYELIDEAVAVVTFGSTVGLEATYWGKPSILVGRAVWDQEGVAYFAASADEAAAMLRGGVAPKPREAAATIGAYYQQGCGVAGSLSWRPGGITGFAVKGRSFLGAKRSSAAYWANRLVNRLLLRL